MDLVGLIKSSCQNYTAMFSERWYRYLLMEIKYAVCIYVCLGVLTSILIAWYIFYKRSTIKRENEQLKTQTSNSSDEMRGLRFRKRDKMLFYGKRMLRKVKNVSGQMYGGQGRKRRAVMRFASSILQLRRENIPLLQMKTVEPPAEYLEEMLEGGDRVPPDALYMLQSIRIFGHFEKPIFLKLCKFTEMISLEPGDYLFKITDPDDSVFIVQSGVIHVCIFNTDGTTLSLKTVRKGESVTSLLSFVDVLSGNPSYYKTVTAKAVEKSVVIRLPMEAFRPVFNENPDIMIRVIQVIMIRLQRVLFTALRSYLGLSTELVQSHMRMKKTAQTGGQKHSPLHRRSTHPESFQHTLSDSMVPPDMLIDIAAETQTHVLHSAQTTVNSQQVPQSNPASLAGSVGNLSQRRYSEVVSNAAAVDINLVKAAAVDTFLWELGLPENDKEFIEPYIELSDVEPGEVLIAEGNVEDVCIWIVLSGSLAVYQSIADATRPAQDEKTELFMYTVHPGEIVGGLAILTGEASTYTIKGKLACRVAFIRRSGIYKIMGERPHIVLDLGNGEVRRLSPLVRQCDYALDWMFLESGRALFRQEELSDSTYIVLSGRMRSVITHGNGKKEIIGEYGKGDLVGIVEMITETGRTTTVMAVRDSELAKLPEGLFNAIKLRYPIVVTKLISLLSHRILGSMQTRPGGSTAPLEANPVTHKYATVALVPISDDVPLTAFTYELFHSLCAIGPTLRLTSEVLRNELGVHIFEARNEYRMTSWLAQQEDRNIITLYQCDTSLSIWTQRCMRQADVVLIVGLGDRLPTVGKFEREIDRLALRTQKELVLLYSESSSSKPMNTLQWLNVRPWVTKHHHLQCPRRMFTRKSQYRIGDLYSRVLMSEPNMHSDFSRMARWLTGNSVGLVLGGGGARGAAHIGMMKAIQEAGIPIDMVGGVSIGALMGALWCQERNVTTVTHKAREWSKKMTKWFLQLLDLTYPITSMFSGREFNKTIRDTFGDVSIEDLWIPYFTLTTDITASCHRVHTNGSLWRYVRSSMSLSGYMPPLCDPKDGHLLLDGGYVNNLPGNLWRYVRASMSIAGVLPPFCDYRDNHLLVDGCYINNVPADVMHNLGAAHIIAIDVGSQDDTDLTNYGDDLSGWWLLYKKWNPFTSPVKVPDLPDIQSRLAYVSCVRQLAEVKNSDYCEYIRPPIDKYKTLAFSSFDEIRDVGYVFGKNHFEAMGKAGRLGRFNKWYSKEPPQKANQSSLNEYTFIDLAHIVCKLPETHASDNQFSPYLYSDYEDYDGYISEPSTYKRQHIKMKRSGSSLSLSENELDSDLEMDFSTTLKQQRDSRKQREPEGDTASIHPAVHWDERLSEVSDKTDNSVSLPSTPALETALSKLAQQEGSGVEELPLDKEQNEETNLKEASSTETPENSTNSDAEASQNMAENMTKSENESADTQTLSKST